MFIHDCNDCIREHILISCPRAEDNSGYQRKNKVYRSKKYLGVSGV